MRAFELLKSCKVIGIDPSTRSLAWAMCEWKGNVDISLCSSGKIDLPKQKGIEPKIETIVAELPAVLYAQAPDIIYVEQTVYIQNYQTSRMLSYVVGATMATAAMCDIPVMEASPLTWKTGLGYKKIMKSDIAGWAAETSPKEATKRANHERKHRVRLILMKRFSSDLSDEERYDSDVIDAIGISTWGCQKQAEKNDHGECGDPARNVV